MSTYIFLTISVETLFNTFFSTVTCGIPIVHHKLSDLDVVQWFHAWIKQYQMLENIKMSSQSQERLGLPRKHVILIPIPGFTIYFSFISCFLWLNVICFDLWWKFGYVKDQYFEQSSLRSRNFLVRRSQYSQCLLDDCL